MNMKKWRRRKLLEEMSHKVDRKKLNNMAAVAATHEPVYKDEEGKTKEPTTPASSAPAIESQFAPASWALVPIKTLSTNTPAMARAVIRTKIHIPSVPNPATNPYTRAASQMISTLGTMGITLIINPPSITNKIKT